MKQPYAMLLMFVLCPVAWAADVDLYVTEPSGETAWYSSQTTSNGLALDFDNRSGYGPEHITLTTSTGGVVVPGEYNVRGTSRSLNTTC